MAAPKDNDNAEIWSEEKANEFLNECYSLTRQKTTYVVYGGARLDGFEFHYIGEVCAELEQYVDLPLYLKNKFTSSKKIYNKIKTKLESNCFSDSKKGIIKEASAIMNLKSNYGWTDRVDNTSKDEKINVAQPTIVFKKFTDE